MSIGERITNIRKSHELTQKKVAIAINMTESAYQRYENDKRIPVLEKLIALADFYNVSIDYLVGRTDNPEVNK